MKFNVTGADKDTGESIEMTIEATDESAAQEVAYRKGIMVSRVAPAALAARPPVAHAVPVSQPLEQGHFRGAPVVNIAPPRRGNSLGIAALVLGILAFLICWIPVVNLLSVPLSALGLLLGLIGLLVAFTRKGASIGFPIAGTAVCGLALFIAISMTGAFVGVLKKASDELVKEAERRNATNQTAAAPTKPEVEWASAETPVKQGDVQVQVKGVRVGKVPLKERIGDSIGESKDVLLMIDIEVANVGETKKLNYYSWGGMASSFDSRTVLTDNFGNRYMVVNFGFSSKVVGSVQSESVYPGKSIRDVLVFEEPIGKVEYLNLELPASHFGGDGMLRIRIPASMIQRM